MFASMTFGFGQLTFTVPNSMLMFYIVVVNFIGGLSMTFHAIGTINFKKNKYLFPQPLDVDIQLSQTPIKNLSNFNVLTGFMTLIISFWHIKKTIGVLSAFERHITDYLILFIVVFLLYGLYAMIPLILAGKNISLALKIGKIENQRKKMEYKKRKIMIRGK
jgi:hypothetical protein